MDRNTILAIVLTFILVISVYFIQSTYYTQDKVPADKNQPQKKLTKKEEAKKEEAKKEEAKKEEAKKDSNKINQSSKGKKVFPTEDYDPSTTAGKEKIKQFQLETDLLQVHFSTMDASVQNLKFKKYLDDQKKYIDAVFKQDDQSVLPLATSFVGAKNLHKKVKTVSQYSVYKYEGKKVAVVNQGTLGEKAQEYQDKIAQNVKKVVNRYKTENNGEMDKNTFHVVLFVSEFYINQNKSEKIRMEKIYTFQQNDYLFDLDIEIVNLTQGRADLVSNDNDKASFYIHWGKSLGPNYKQGESRFDEVLATGYLKFEDDGDRKDVEVDDYRTNIKRFKWLGVDSRYLVACIVPDWTNLKGGAKKWDKEQYFGEIYPGETKESDGFLGLFSSKVKVKQNQEIIGIGFDDVSFKQENDTKQFHLSILISPKARSSLSQDKYDDFEFIEVRNRGWTSFIKPVEWAIEWLLFKSYELVQNFGLAIILVTIALKILLHPLSKKSIDSSRKMSQLQPKIQELNKKYEKNPQAKQKAMMELYKREKINPLGGCIPLLLQMPVFFALYNVLPSLIELKNADFLWINDLSSPDTVANINLFITNKLNILPIIMVVASVFQTKLMPQPTAPSSADTSAQTQKMMQYMMPVVFLFIFWSMPSGLVLYWTVQSILQILQQLFSNLMDKRKKPAAKSKSK